MSKLYDAILVKGTLRPRLNKVLVSPEVVPKEVLDTLTLDNIVNEHGIIIVDKKIPAEGEGGDAAPAEDDGKLTRIDQPAKDKPTPQEDPESDGKEETEPAITDDDNVDTGAIAVDDSANDEEGEDDEPSTTDQNPKNQNAPVAKAAPQEDPEPADNEPEEKVSKQRKRTTAAPEPRFRSVVPQSTPGMGFPRKNGKTVDIFDLKTPHTHVRLVGNVTVPLSAASYQTKGEIDIVNRLHELGIETVDFNALEREANASEATPAGLIMDADEEDDDIKLG